MIEKLNKDEDQKRIKWFGLKMGFLFLCISIILGGLLVITFVPILESIASKITSVTNIHSGIIVFSISIIGVLLPAYFYIKGVLNKSPSINRSLLILFSSSIIFLNTAIFYSTSLDPNVKMGAQGGLGLLFLPIMTSWIYLVIGYIHDAFNENNHKNYYWK